MTPSVVIPMPMLKRVTHRYYSGGSLQFVGFASSDSLLDQVEVRYGGSDANLPFTPARAAVSVENAAPTLTHVTIDHSRPGIVLEDGAAPVVSDLTVRDGRDDAIYVDAHAGALTIDRRRSVESTTGRCTWRASRIGLGLVTVIDAGTVARGSAAYVAGWFALHGYEPATRPGWQRAASRFPPVARLLCNPAQFSR